MNFCRFRQNSSQENTLRTSDCSTLISLKALRFIKISRITHINGCDKQHAISRNCGPKYLYNFVLPDETFPADGNAVWKRTFT